VYGATLFVFAFLAAGGGHGTYLPFAVFGAPLSLLHQKLGLFGVLILWPIAGFVLGGSRRLIWPLLLLLGHLAAVGAILTWGTPFESPEEQWQYLEAAQRRVGAIWSGLAIYAVGQLLAWAALLLRRFVSDGAGPAG
jgi:hypothetical protein